MSNPYPGGQCTWGAAELFPCLQNLSQYGNFGNGGDWFRHAEQIGLPTSSTPVVGWLASFATEGWPSGPGDVGLITAVNTDGTVTRYGTNWHMDGRWSTDKVKQSIIIGAFQPPCSSSGVVTTGTQTLSSSSSCRTFQWSLPFGINICFDAVIGTLAVTGGISMMVGGLALILISVGFGMKSDSGSDKQSQRPQQEPQQPQQPQTNSPTGQTVAQPSSSQADIVQRSRQRAAQRNLNTNRPSRSSRGGKPASAGPKPPIPTSGPGPVAAVPAV